MIFKKLAERFSTSDPQKGGLENSTQTATTADTVCDGKRGLIAQNRFGCYCVPRTSAYRPAARRVLNGMVHEPRTIRFIRQHAGTGDVVHAGTYFGDFIPGIAKSLAPGSLLWAFEPVPENHWCASQTVALNGLNNVRLFHAGVGARRDSLKMVVTDPDGNSLGGGSRIAKVNRKGAVNITVLPIDETVPTDRTVSVIQLDVEGHELPALQGAWQTIQRSWPILILEILGKNNTLQSAWFQEHILAAGYEILGKVHENTVLAKKGRSVNTRLLSTESCD